MNLALLAECANECASSGQPMTWWQALIVAGACFTFALVVVVFLMGGPRR